MLVTTPGPCYTLGSKPHQSLLIPHQNSSSAPVICVASASSAPAILTHEFMPEPHQVRPPPPQLILYSSGPPRTCSDQSPLAILTSPQCLEHPQVLGSEPPWSAEPDNIYVPNILELHQRIVEQHHNSRNAGHPGWWKTLELILWNYWWPQMSQYIGSYTSTCNLYLQTKPQH
ncbi:hypothetical protein E4T56_gene8705 [Termitomyces sp. T112]|nr:hypothetical protein E4T56_gene8705 [Termitomyces sp. T112]